ncbi:MAG: HlyD family efflux transporter periplasmic adaptor subunit [Oscillospiraceae bacterium]|nr:HlyD family efflux transporter periplasmic adaptor subunit [Oscillospiraceae bacterium]MDD4368854.1 HlyD family efflux transporter periplasmic adaptor subunit [Oscillospiraceae bacterium]
MDKHKETEYRRQAKARIAAYKQAQKAAPRRSGAVPAKAVPRKRQPAPAAPGTVKPGVRRAGPGSQPPAAATAAGVKPSAAWRQLKRKQDRARTLSLALLLLIVLVVVLALIKLWLTSSPDDSSLQFVYEGTLQEAYDTKALIIRDESLQTAQTSGTLRTLVPEGYHTAVGEELAMVISPDHEDLLSELDAYDQEISDLQLQLIADHKVEGADSIFEQTDSQLEGQMADLRQQLATGDMTNLASLANSVQAIMTQRNSQLAYVDFNSASLDALEKERTQVERALASGSQTLTASDSGLISFHSDGLESVLTPEALSSLTPELLSQYLTEAAEIAPLATAVSSGQPVMRQIVGVTQYFAFFVKDLEASYFSDLSSFSLALTNENATVTDCSIVSVTDSTEGAFVICSSDREVGRLLDQRVVSVRLVAREISGLEVPLEALLNTDTAYQTADLFVVRSGFVHRIKVNILAHDDSKAIVEAVDESDGLSQGSIISLDPQNLTDGQSIDQNQ